MIQPQQVVPPGQVCQKIIIDQKKNEKKNTIKIKLNIKIIILCVDLQWVL